MVATPRPMLFLLAVASGAMLSGDIGHEDVQAFVGLAIATTSKPGQGTHAPDNQDFLVHESKIPETETEKRECGICLESILEGGNLVSLPCHLVSNEYHLECMLAWAKVKEQCPLCRTPDGRIQKAIQKGQWLRRVRISGRDLENAPSHLRADREVVLEAFKKSGWLALRWASSTLKADRVFVREAVKNEKSANALHWADKTLQADREIVLEAVKHDGMALLWADPTLKADREIVLEAVKEKGAALNWADPTLKADHEIVLQAAKEVGKYAFDWEWADDTLKADRVFVREAVKKSADSLQWADDTLKADREIVLEAVKHDGTALQWADPTLKADREIVLEAVKRNVWALQWASSTLKADLEFIEALRRVYKLMFASRAEALG